MSCIHKVIKNFCLIFGGCNLRVIGIDTSPPAGWQIATQAQVQADLNCAKSLIKTNIGPWGIVFFEFGSLTGSGHGDKLETDKGCCFTCCGSKFISEGKLKAVGKVVNKNKTQFIAESVVYDSEGNEIGRGNGVFVRSKLPLNQAKGYSA